MTGIEILGLLKQGKTVGYEAWTWDRYNYECFSNDEEYSCCYENFNSAEEALEHLVGVVGSDLSEVYKY